MRHAKIFESPPRLPDLQRQAGSELPEPPPPFQPRPTHSAFAGLFNAALVAAIFWAALALLILWLR